LRDESVHVERRAVDRPIDPDLIDQLDDQAIEVTAMGEEAVVQKQARIVEEVVVSKDVHERQETISDTLRRTEVDIDKGDSSHGSRRR
jgi:uncharacterized protein (TIGR02271 family)